MYPLSISKSMSPSSQYSYRVRKACAPHQSNSSARTRRREVVRSTVAEKYCVKKEQLSPSPRTLTRVSPATAFAALKRISRLRHKFRDSGLPNMRLFQNQGS
ncbi:predicted protein [Chaetomium globosum CBS 148.51]|uniref:Uncharacterized protein n=1 Tax=Chaetomium globosum (strain ATCC 6205 / CBS 148.51 / DSM 1962 / NBRC 6347 / NRRL 1970) TaxID=306901 RepID=Q2HHZ4_CHAGB|nr:uncharacterized protein CHGG_00160 [Chaetomium globosum CBS 148.51]EAQ91925.1 predicted protein [Chaetomium globosum CBS 148.51]